MTLHEQFQRLKLDEGILTKEWKRIFDQNPQQAEDFYLEHIDPVQLKLLALEKEVLKALKYDAGTEIVLSHSLISVYPKAFHNGYHYHWTMV